MTNDGMNEHEQLRGLVVQVRELLAARDELQHKLFRVALAVSDPDRDHFDRCVDIYDIVGPAERWTP